MQSLSFIDATLLLGFAQTPRHACRVLVNDAAQSLTTPSLRSPIMVKTAQRARYTSRNPWSKPLPPPAAPPMRTRQPRRVKLPQEIVDVIIDYVWDHSETLKSCSLCAKSFVLQTRKHLFCKFDIKLSRSTRNLRLINLFKRSPYLKQYIEDLVVVVQAPTAQTVSLEEVPIVEVLPTLDHIRRLTIKAYGGSPVDWQTGITSASRRALSSILMADHVNSCSLHNILNFDSLYLSRCLSLRQLGLSGHSTLTAYNPPQYFSNPSPYISSLTIGDFEGSFQSLLNCCMEPRPAFKLNNLQALDVEEDLARWTFGDLPFLLSTLTELVIRLRRYPDDGLPIPEPINLSHFQRLSTFELRSIDDRKGMIFALRSARIIESISQPSLLRRVSFNYDPTPDRWATTDSSFNEAYWSCVDAALFHLPVPPLSSVQFEYGMSVLFSDSVKAFPKVRSLGVYVHISSLPE